MNSRTTLTVIVIVVVIIGAAVAVVYTRIGTGHGTLSLAVADSPAGTPSDLYLTISGIELQGTGNSTTDFHIANVQFDLFSLVNVTKILGNDSVPAGNYTMIRFNITSAIATMGGINSTLTVPSGQVKVPVQFQIKSGATTRIVLDITADMTNISASGNLRPVVTVKSVTGP